ncbi:hypothetical protein ERJ75_000331600 [Trypanosoma vivax]|uniref:Uncharacterized protein n=1 Tax=Trypanosoma vivax (strain Y486) TaxID=1055687 RepID=G0UAJ1_TRYVY|nr:hypothetical protein ERJ75_000331600 [Trypanosoma vivax]CCC52824.1 conserved hypothetical protein [Trypanosoma vivax Y486]
MRKGRRSPAESLSSCPCSDASGALQYLDGQPLCCVAGQDDDFVLRGASPFTEHSPSMRRSHTCGVGASMELRACEDDGARYESRASRAPVKERSVQATAMKVLKYAAGGVATLFGGLLRSRESNDGGEEDDHFLQIIHTNEPLATSSEAACEVRSVNKVLNCSDVGVQRYGSDGEGEEEEEEEEPLRVEIDLVSTLRAYAKTPNDCFGHLVAAALYSRSADNLVSGAELKEAQLNPYLVQMLVECDFLNVSDVDVHQEVQRCVDSLIPAGGSRVSQDVCAYLASFFKLHFIRLNREQHRVVKGSGFEFVQLLSEHSHVVPPDPLGIGSLKQLLQLWYVDILAMLFNIFFECLCIVGIILVLLYWVLPAKASDVENRGFFTAICYGIGYAAHLICMIFLMRGKERDTVYGEMVCSFPSPHLHVVPVIPLYNIVSVVAYLRNRLADGGVQHLAAMHDIVAAQILSSLCFSHCVAVPQVIFQTYLGERKETSSYHLDHDSFRLLSTAVGLTYLISMCRLLRMFSMFNSINSLGFACFGPRAEQIIEQSSALIRMAYVSGLLVFEANIFVLVVASENMYRCNTYAVLFATLSGISLAVLCATYLFLSPGKRSRFHVAWTLVPLTCLHVGSLIYSKTDDMSKCGMFDGFRGVSFNFWHASWLPVFCFLVLWLIQVLIVHVGKRRSLASQRE